MPPYDERDEESQRFTAKYSDGDFLEAVGQFDDGARTADVVDVVGCQPRTARHRLGELEADGRVESRQVGNAKLWYVA